MNLTTLTSAQLRQALVLKEQIEILEQQLAAITGSALVEVATSEVDVETAETEVAAKAPAKRGKRGAVKEAVIDLVRKAGRTGITIKEISSALGRSYGSISVWFNSTGKKVKQIVKVGRGKYGWVGVSSATEPAPTITAEKPKAKKANGNRRGELKDSIASLVKGSGKAGITAKEVASSLGLALPRVYNWFLSTGKKVKQIKKVGPAKYAWAGASATTAEPAVSAKPSPEVKSAKPKAKKSGEKSYGSVKESIIQLVQKSGKSGITVGEIAKNLGVRSGNIYSWFTSTGKKVKAIKKIGPGQYTWVG